MVQLIKEQLVFIVLHHAASSRLSLTKSVNCKENKIDFFGNSEVASLIHSVSKVAYTKTILSVKVFTAKNN